MGRKVYRYIHRKIDLDRQIDRLTDKQIFRYTGRQIHRLKDRQEDRLAAR